MQQAGRWLIFMALCHFFAVLNSQCQLLHRRGWRHTHYVSYRLFLLIFLRGRCRLLLAPVSEDFMSGVIQSLYAEVTLALGSHLIHQQSFITASRRLQQLLNPSVFPSRAAHYRPTAVSVSTVRYSACCATHHVQQYLRCGR